MSSPSPSASAASVLSTPSADFHHQQSSGGRKREAAPTSTNAPLFDTHCHIGLGFSYSPDSKDPVPTDPFWPFKDEAGQFQCEEEFVRAIDGGVTKMTLVGIDAASTERVWRISEHLNKLVGNSAVGLAYATTTSASASSAAAGGTAAAAETATAPAAYWSAGIHPHSAHLHAQEFPPLEKLIRDGATRAAAAATAGTPSYSRLVAVGETGMDFFKSKGSLQEQKASLMKHLELAYELDLPVIIHARNADDELILAFEEFIASKQNDPKQQPRQPQQTEGGGDGVAAAVPPSTAATTSPWYNGGIRGVMHCFSSDAKWMDRYLKLGFFVSFTNNITYKKSVEIQDACARCPTDRIVIETDSPFLPPQRIRGEGNQPCNTRDTFEQACKLRGISLSDAAKMDAFQKKLWENSHKLFGIPY